jgi:Transcriptional antiterminator
MQVLKKINNNVVLALDENGQEIIVVGKGLGFYKTPYTLTDAGLIEHIFVNARNNKILEAFYELPTEHILLTQKIIEMGKSILRKDLNKNILLTLSDHISYAIERHHNKIEFDCPLKLDIQYLYPEEVIVGKMAVSMIKTELGIELSKDEISMIAMHFINAEYNLSGMQETYQMTDTISHIISIVEDYYEIKLDEDSLYYARFATHLRYFILRQKQGIQFLEDGNHLSVELADDEGRKLKGCVEKIKQYAAETFGWSCSKEEQIYLMIHINHLIFYKSK